MRVQRDQILGMMPGETVAWDLLDKYYDSYGWLYVLSGASKVGLIAHAGYSLFQSLT